MATKEDQAREAYAAIAKPVTEETFVQWYCKTHKKKSTKKRARAEDDPSAANVVVVNDTTKKAKKQQTIFGAAHPKAPLAASKLSKGKRTALLKQLLSSLKSSIKSHSKKWHPGDSASKIGTMVCGSDEFMELFDINLENGVLTHFALDTRQIEELFGTLITNLKVQTCMF